MTFTYWILFIFNTVMPSVIAIAAYKIGRRNPDGVALKRHDAAVQAEVKRLVVTMIEEANRD